MAADDCAAAAWTRRWRRSCDLGVPPRDDAAGPCSDYGPCHAAAGSDQRVLSELGVRDRVQAVVLACEAGIVTPGDSR
jgi:hypothetical protein